MVSWEITDSPPTSRSPLFTLIPPSGSHLFHSFYLGRWVKPRKPWRFRYREGGGNVKEGRWKGPVTAEAWQPTERNEPRRRAGSKCGKGKGTRMKRGQLAIPYHQTAVQVRLKVGRNFLTYVGESIGRWLLHSFYNRMVQVVTCQFPRFPHISKSRQWILSLASAFLARALAEHRFLLDRNESVFQPCVSFRSRTTGRVSSSPRNRAGSRAIEKREERDREADNVWGNIVARYVSCGFLP